MAKKMQEIAVVPTFKVENEHLTKVRDLLLSMVPRAQGEEGLLSYELYEAEIDGEPELLLIERFESEEDLQRHRYLPYVMAFRDAVRPYLKETFPMTIWKRLA